MSLLWVSFNHSNILKLGLVNSQIESDPIHEYKIALQFPDGLINDSIYVIDELQTHFMDFPTTIVFFILGDTSYGEWCVDEVNAQHYCDQIDLIVHFGKTWLSRPKTTKTVFVLERYAIDMELSQNGYEKLDLKNKVEQNSDTNVSDTLVMADCGYQYVLNQATDLNCLILPPDFPTIPACKIDNQDHISSDTVILGRHIHSPTSNFDLSSYKNLVFLCDPTTLDENVTYKALLLNYSHLIQIYTLDATSSQTNITQVEYRHNRFLMQRYGLVSKIQESEIILIINQSITNTSDSEKSNCVCNMLKDVITKSGKKYYEILIGKLNEPKIENFVSADLCVLVACRENKFYYDEQFGAR